MMLLVVINDEQTQGEQSSGNAARDLGCPVDIPDGAGEGRNEKDRGGRHVPPASQGRVVSVRLGSQQ